MDVQITSKELLIIQLMRQIEQQETAIVQMQQEIERLQKQLEPKEKAKTPAPRGENGLED